MSPLSIDKIKISMFLASLVAACQPEPENFTAVFVGHVRSYTGNDLSDDFKGLDIEGYDVVLLGGDLMADTTSEIEKLEAFVSVGSSSVLWAPGNHDYSYPDVLRESTGRETFYSYVRGGVKFIVLDTERDSSLIIGDQLEFFKREIGGFFGEIVVIHHKLIWLDAIGVDPAELANSPRGDCSYCLPESLNFEADLMGLVEGLGQRITFIGGDVGNYVGSFEFIHESGAKFLASGMGPSFSGFIQINVNDGNVKYKFREVTK